MARSVSRATSQPRLPVHHFATLFPTTRHDAHTARHRAEAQLAAWGRDPAYDEPAAAAALLVGELTANAALHGQVQEGEARLDLTLTGTTLRIEVTDARGDRPPVVGAEGETEESGRGLLLVTALADNWGVAPRPPGGKTVWAECRWPGDRLIPPLLQHCPQPLCAEGGD